jgi:hypothetical protein
VRLPYNVIVDSSHDARPNASVAGDSLVRHAEERRNDLSGRLPHGQASFHALLLIIAHRAINSVSPALKVDVQHLGLLGCEVDEELLIGPVAFDLEVVFVFARVFDDECCLARL